MNDMPCGNFYTQIKKCVNMWVCQYYTQKGFEERGEMGGARG